MDRLIEPLKATCQTKVKTNAVKQECEKQDELKRSALRAFMALIVIPDAGKQLIKLFSCQLLTEPLFFLFFRI